MSEWAFSAVAKIGVSEEEALSVLEKLGDEVAISWKGDRLGTTFTVTAYTLIGAVTSGLAQFSASLDGHDYQLLEAEATTYEELDARFGEKGDLLVGVTEIAKMINRTRQRAGQVTQMAGFPEPYARLASGPVWRRHEVEDYLGHLVGRYGAPSVPQTA